MSAVWLPLIGPAAYLVWRLLVGLVDHPTGVAASSLEDLAVAVGLGSARGNQAGIVRSLRRLERFGLAWRPTKDLVVVRASLPPVAGRYLRLLHPSVRRRHEALRVESRPNGT